MNKIKKIYFKIKKFFIVLFLKIVAIKYLPKGIYNMSGEAGRLYHRGLWLEKDNQFTLITIEKPSNFFKKNPEKDLKIFCVDALGATRETWQFIKILRKHKIINCQIITFEKIPSLTKKLEQDPDLKIFVRLKSMFDSFEQESLAHCKARKFRIWL